MIERKTVIDVIEITRAGDVQVCIGLLLVEDGTEIDCKAHRVLLRPGDDVNAKLGEVNGNLKANGRPELKDTKAIEELKSIVRIVHTDERITATAAQRAKAEAETEARAGASGGKAAPK